MRILVLYNDDGGLLHGVGIDAVAVRAVEGAARAVAGACRSLGHEAFLVAAPGEARRLLDAIDGVRPDLVFNLVESLNGDPRLESAVALLLELEGLAFTGSPPLALSMALDKPAARAMLESFGVPVPVGSVLHTGDEALRGASPWIVKPAREDASHGISLASVVADEAAVRARARFVHATYGQAALVEEFIAGREFNASVIGLGEEVEVLSLGEIDFSTFPAGRPHVVTYEAKWDVSSPEYKGTPSVEASGLDEALRRRIVRTARLAYAALGLRDYGRIDMRLSHDGTPLVIDVNPNPDISPDAGLARAAARSGRNYVELIGSIVTQAAARRGHPPRSPRP